MKLLFNSVEGYTFIEQLWLCGFIQVLLSCSRPQFLIFLINKTYCLPRFEHEFGVSLLGIYSLLVLNMYFFLFILVPLIMSCILFLSHCLSAILQAR